MSGVQKVPKEGAEVARGWKKAFLVVLVVAGLSGCGILQGQLLDDSFWAGSPFHSNQEAELGIAELAKGNYKFIFPTASHLSSLLWHLCGTTNCKSRNRIRRQTHQV